MKCPCCGGEVSSQSTHCPYCGNLNPEGVAFQKKVQEKIERNRLLKPFLIRQKTPELVQKMLTRIALVLTGIMGALFVISIGLYIWGSREEARTPAKGSSAERYTTLFAAENENYYFNNFIWRMNEAVDLIEEGEMPEREALEDLVRDAVRLLYEAQDYDEAHRREAELTLQAFFRGYLGLSGEEASFLEPGEDGTYDGYPAEELTESAVLSMERRIKEVLP